MGNNIENRKQKIILLDGQFEKQIKELNIYIDELLETTNEDVKEDLAWAYYWLARATYKMNKDNIFNKFNEIEKALKQSLEYKGVLNGEYKAVICWLLGNLYKKVHPIKNYKKIERLYLESARYYYKIYNDNGDLNSLLCYADLYNNLADLRKSELDLKISLNAYKILLNKGIVDNDYMQDVYETAYALYRDINKIKESDYYFNKINNVEILHNLNNNKTTNEIG